jgi:hypothetical protein
MRVLARQGRVFSVGACQWGACQGCIMCNMSASGVWEGAWEGRYMRRPAPAHPSVAGLAVCQAARGG